MKSYKKKSDKKSGSLKIFAVCLFAALFLGACAAAPSGEFSALSELTFALDSPLSPGITVIEIAPDGSFKGQFFEEDYRDKAAGYIGGNVYISDFEGRFSYAGTEEAGTLKVEEFELLGMVGSVGMQDSVRWTFAVPWGLKDIGVGSELFYARKDAAEAADALKTASADSAAGYFLYYAADESLFEGAEKTGEGYEYVVFQFE